MKNPIPSRERTLHVATLVDKVFKVFKARNPLVAIDVKLRVEWTIYFLNHGVWFQRQIDAGLLRMSMAKQKTLPTVDEFTAWCLADPPPNPCEALPAEALKKQQTIIREQANKPKRVCPLRDTLNKFK